MNTSTPPGSVSERTPLLSTTYRHRSWSTSTLASLDGGSTIIEHCSEASEDCNWDTATLVDHEPPTSTFVLALLFITACAMLFLTVMLIVSLFWMSAAGVDSELLMILFYAGLPLGLLVCICFAATFYLFPLEDDACDCRDAMWMAFSRAEGILVGCGCALLIVQIMGLVGDV